MKTVVLGGSGFVGAHLVKALLEAGDRVVVVDRQLPALAPRWPGAEYLIGDHTAQNPATVHAALLGADVLYFLAWHMLPTASNYRPGEDVCTNLLGALQLLDLCVQSGVKRVVFFSSGGVVYGPAQSLPIAEDHPAQPITSHAINKLAVESYLRIFHQMHGLEYVILRPGNPYGPWQDPCSGQGVVAAFLTAAEADEPLEIWGDGNTVRDFFAVSDLARCAVLAARTSHAQEVYNVGSGVGHSLLEVVDEVRAVVGRELEVRTLPPRPFDVPVNVLDVRRAQEKLGWRAEVGFSEGLRWTWEVQQAEAQARRRRRSCR